MKQEKAAHKLLQKQVIIRRVLLALLPCIAGSIYFFGWRSLAIIIWAGMVGFFTELIFARSRSKPVTEAVFVTTTIFALIMPPTVGFHVLTIGVIFAVMFTKEVFGGFGKNIFNPALAGRCFVYICFPIAMTATWSPPADGFGGALGKWTTADSPDAITGATPMANIKAGKLVLSSDEDSTGKIPFDITEGNTVKLKKSALLRGLVTGRISGTMGVTSAFLILIGGMYLFVTKTASRTIIISLIAAYAVLNQILYWSGVEPVPQAWNAVLGGGFLFGAFFMATDPVSAPRTEPAKIFYGIIIAVCTVVIRNFSIFNGGLMFSILIGNMFAPTLDNIVRYFKEKKNKQPEIAA
ncbi:MAG: RnfABCDGE type electron transport complex subunit D [Sedimentisphaerales bacterium]|nr:RnfABCDGE type electron transport complex subunit D [Sedimentisphaerales bacterium]